MKYENEGRKYQLLLGEIYKIDLSKPDSTPKDTKVVNSNKGDRIFVGGFLR